MVYKPNSVPLVGAAVIDLGHPLPAASSNLPGTYTHHLGWFSEKNFTCQGAISSANPWRGPVGADESAPGQRFDSLFGLAPGGVCHAGHVAIAAVRSYRTFSPLPFRQNRNSAVCSLWHFPAFPPLPTETGGCYPPPRPAVFGLSSRLSPSDRPTISSVHY